MISYKLTGLLNVIIGLVLLYFYSSGDGRSYGIVGVVNLVFGASALINRSK